MPGIAPPYDFIISSTSSSWICNSWSNKQLANTLNQGWVQEIHDDADMDVASFAIYRNELSTLLKCMIMKMNAKLKCECRCKNECVGDGRSKANRIVKMDGCNDRKHNISQGSWDRTAAGSLAHILHLFVNESSRVSVISMVGDGMVWDCGMVDI